MGTIVDTSKMCIALKWMGRGACLVDISDGEGHVSNQTTSHAIEAFADFVRENKEQQMQFSFDRENINRRQQLFYEMYEVEGRRFPGVVGILDNTHIAIQKPKTDQFDFHNRKNFHSLNVLTVVGPSLEFMYLYTGGAGRSHDSAVLSQTYLVECLEQLLSEDHYLLADMGYALRRNIMIQFRQPSTANEELFNQLLKKLRCVVERAIGILKARFRCLSYKRCGPLPFPPEKASKVIMACTLLHNYLIRNGVPLPDPERDVIFPVQTPDDPDTATGELNRRRIMARIFH